MKYPKILRPITLVEVPPFERTAAASMTDSELDAFKEFIARNPEAGVRVRGTGGVRKVRWATGGKGKSGGARVIYYYHSEEIPLFLLLAYAKSHKESLDATEKAELRRLTGELVDTYRGKRDHV